MLGAGDTINDREEAGGPLLAVQQDKAFHTGQAWHVQAAAAREHALIKPMPQHSHREMPDDRSHVIATP